MIHLYTDQVFSYISTVSGLIVVDLESETEYANILYPVGFSSVWGNTNYVYVATSCSGIFYFDKDYLTTNSGSLDYSGFLYNLVDSPDLYSSDVYYLHGYDYTLACCSSGGVNVIRTISGTEVDYVVGKSFSGAKKCFITSSGNLYYTSTVSGYDYLDIVYTTLIDWATPDKSYSSVYRGLFRMGIILNDIFVTERTGADYYDTIFVATSSGVYVIDGGNDSYRVYMAG